ncbi:hypothetical protein NC651_035965 [Populus alba x Populus x berolinensis]|nr:hypothetical protein NC651_035965 [Populus alba x Populus x berolinensis]
MNSVSTLYYCLGLELPIHSTGMMSTLFHKSMLNFFPFTRHITNEYHAKFPLDCHALILPLKKVPWWCFSGPPCDLL